jgi:hypothetical protein
MITIRLWITAAILMVSLQTFAHGEDKPGLHGGYIRMPGAFHTEVIPLKHGFEVMLLDMQFQHPLVKDSYVKASVEVAGKITDLKCEASKESFLCATSVNLLRVKGKLTISAQRAGAPAAVAVYKLPLQRE